MAVANAALIASGVLTVLVVVRVLVLCRYNGPITVAVLGVMNRVQLLLGTLALVVFLAVVVTAAMTGGLVVPHLWRRPRRRTSLVAVFLTSTRCS